MSGCYRLMGTAERFRAQAYANAANTLRNMQEPVELYADSLQHLDTLTGIGESIATKILEYLATGSIAAFDELKEEVPYELVELLDVEGIGAATLKTLYQQRGIRNKEELITALQQNKLQGLAGFGSKKIMQLCKALKIKTTQQRLPYATASETAKKVIRALRMMPGIEQCTIAGSLRRKSPTIGDIDIVCEVPAQKRKRVARQLLTLPFVYQRIAAGSTRISFRMQQPDIQVDIRLVDKNSFGAALLYFTGNKEHNIELRTIARKKGWKINEYGVFEIKTGRRLAGADEAGIYQLLGFAYIEPEWRLGGRELQTSIP